MHLIANILNHKTKFDTWLNFPTLQCRLDYKKWITDVTCNLGSIAKSEQKHAEIWGNLSVHLKGHYNYGAEYFIYF